MAEFAPRKKVSNEYLINNFLESTHQKIKFTFSSSGNIIDAIPALLIIADEKRWRERPTVARLKFKTSKVTTEEKKKQETNSE